MDWAILISVIGLFLILFFWLDSKFSEIYGKLGEHDTADKVLAEKATGLDKRLATLEDDFRDFRAEYKDDIRALNNKLDTLILARTHKEPV